MTKLSSKKRRNSSLAKKKSFIGSAKCCQNLFLISGEEQSQQNSFRLSPGVNFINILRAAFTAVDPKSVKTY